GATVRFLRAVAFLIRPASEDDAEEIGAALVAAGIDAWGSFLGEERIVAANRDRTHPADLVAVDDDGVFGLRAWGSHTRGDARLHVPRGGQRQGAGAAPLSHALGALRAAGREDAWLHREERNPGARRFYEAQGWKQTGPPLRRHWHGAALVEPRYVKRLTGE